MQLFQDECLPWFSGNKFVSLCCYSSSVEMWTVILLSAALFVTANSQAAQTIQPDPICVALEKRALDDLLKNPPNVPDPLKFLECLPRKLIRQFTTKEAPHVAITFNCLQTPNSQECLTNGKGYQIVADSLIQIFRLNNRCFDCNDNHPNVDFAISLLQRRHPRLLQKGLLFLTENT